MVMIKKTELRAHTSRLVDASECATRWGREAFDVLSTPSILGNVEVLCAEALKPYLEAAEVSVGISVELSHRAPTPVGNRVDYFVRAGEVARRTEFAFEVRDHSGAVVCEGTHSRAVVRSDDFRKLVAAREVAYPGPSTGPGQESAES